MCWSRSSSTSRRDWMVYPTKCPWGCRTWLSLFWRICLTIFFAQGAIPDNIRRGMITLLKKGGRHVSEDLNYSPITLLHTELKILARVLANRLHLVISDLIELEQNYAVEEDRSRTTLQDPRGVKKWHWSHADQSRSVQGLQQGGPSVLGEGSGDCRILTSRHKITIGWLTCH